MTAQDKVDAIKSRWQALDKMQRTGIRDEYEREAIRMYHDLHDTWSLALEEANLDRADVREGLLSRDDRDPAENVPVPGSDELMREIERLENWLRTVGGERR